MWGYDVASEMTVRAEIWQVDGDTVVWSYVFLRFNGSTAN